MRVPAPGRRELRHGPCLAVMRRGLEQEGTAAMYSQWELVISPSSLPNDRALLIILLTLIGGALPLFLIISARPRASQISVWAACLDC